MALPSPFGPWQAAQPLAVNSRWPSDARVAAGVTRGGAVEVAAPEVEGVSGKYFVKSKIAKSTSASHEGDAQERLWQLSEELTDFRY